MVSIQISASVSLIWNTGAIGVAVAFDRFEIAAILSALNFCTLLVFKEIKETLDENKG
jgi:putative Mg2+ transporter-C (MgtC) family protein